MIRAMDTETDQGKAVLITKPNSFCEPKSWYDCMMFLATNTEMGCWNADYDCQAILKFLPKAVRNRIAILGESSYQFYEIRYVKKKFMKVWYEGRLLFTIFDIQQFYNCKLKTAAEKLGVQAKGEIPQSWYSHIKEVLQNPKTRERLLNYAIGDAITLQQIINRTVDAFQAAGLKFEHPYSNASFSERVFRKKFSYQKHWKAERAAREAYYGGRIECLQAGYFRTAYYYDIHSAYPSAIAGLLKPNGFWINTPYIRDDAVYAFVDCEIAIPHTEQVGPIPVKRRSGLIIYPLGKFRSTITLTEFRYLEERGWITQVYQAWQHAWPTRIYPFEEVKAIYKKRQKHPAQSYALKIVLNATYGKMAQIIETMNRTNIVNGKTELFDGRSWKKKEKWKDHTSFVYASEITARIRMRLMREILSDKVIFYATDGVMTTEPIPGLKVGSGLGQWEGPEVVRDLIVIGSGVYTYRTKESGGKEYQVTTKFRGFSPELNLHEALKRAGRLHILRTHVLRNTSLRQAATQRKDSLNILRETTRSLLVNFDRKRKWDHLWNAGELTETNFTSQPWIYYRPVMIVR